MPKPSSHQEKPRVSVALSAALAGAMVLGLFNSSLAGLVSGGGAATSDCYVELDVVGVESAQVVKNKKVLCTDGDPCDTTGGCGDGCTFRVAVCPNRCTPAKDLEPPLVAKQKGKGGVVLPPPASLDGSVCGAFVDLPVALRKNGKKPGKTKITLKAKAAKGTKPRKDVDNITLQCLPRVGACPTTTTTTTTTTTLSTTSTTAPPGCCNFTSLSFTTGVGSGNCGEVVAANGSPLITIQCGGLYFGGGSNSVPLPAKVPDLGVSYTNVSSCDPDTGALGLTARTATETGSIRTCTEAGCLFGPPLPIPNSTNTATSTCVINTVAGNASGSASCGTGTSNIDLPLSSEIFLNGDLLLDGGHPGIQPCPLCEGDPTPADGIQGGTCNGGANNGGPCDAQTTVISSSYPTSHDCPSLAGNSVGSLPIAFNLTTGTSSDTAANLTVQARVFCGYCWDDDVSSGDGGPGTCSGDSNYTCLNTLQCSNAGKGRCEGPALPCESDADCTSASASRDSCKQKDPGAFSKSAAFTITATGTPAGDLSDGLDHPAKMVSVFCIPPTFDATVDNAGALPGPGAAALDGQARLQ